MKKKNRRLSSCLTMNAWVTKNLNGKSLCLVLEVHLSFDFLQVIMLTFTGCIAEDWMKLSVECVVWMSGLQENCKQL